MSTLTKLPCRLKEVEEASTEKLKSKETSLVDNAKKEATQQMAKLKENHAKEIENLSRSLTTKYETELEKVRKDKASELESAQEKLSAARQEAESAKKEAKALKEASSSRVSQKEKHGISITAAAAVVERESEVKKAVEMEFEECTSNFVQRQL